MLFLVSIVPLQRLHPTLARFASLVFAALSTASAFGSTPAIAGKWLGTAGTPDDQAMFGLEITAEPEGALVAAVYFDQLSYYGARLPEIKDAGAGRFKVSALGLALTLADDRLSGSIFGGHVPVAMSRTQQLPTEPEPPADLPRGPEPRWQTQLDGAIYATAAVRDGIAYVGTTAGIFCAVNAADGQVAWTFKTGGPVFGEALVTESSVYFTCDDGRLYKLARDTGREQWHHELGDAPVARVLPDPEVNDYDYRAPRPLLVDGVIYVGSGDGSFHAVDAASGRSVWRLAAQGKVRTDAAAMGANVIFTTLGGQVCVVNRTDGRELWHRDYKAAVTSSPVVSGKTLFVGGRDSQLRALRAETGEQIWQRGFWGSWVESAPAVAGDVLYVGSSDLRRLGCHDLETGNVRWRTDVFGFAWARPLVTESHIYIGTSGAHPYLTRHRAALCILDRATGRLLARWPLAQPENTFLWGFVGSPAASDDTLIIGALNGVLYGFPLQR